ncbi:MAG: hypothetical protein KDA81_11240 [Planctomycetaceae bacterium]|nr:hypothetical protein [Planctomycetaceae bacterium]
MELRTSNGSPRHSAKVITQHPEKRLIVQPDAAGEASIGRNQPGVRHLVKPRISSRR